MGFSDLDVAQSGMYLKIKSGEPVTIRLLQETPAMETLHGFGKAASKCEGKECIFCKDPENKAKPRFSINVYSHDLQKVMVWSFGKGVFGQIRDIESNLSKQDVKLTDTDIAINAKGENMEKRYTVQPNLKSKKVPEGLTLYEFVDKVDSIPF